MSLLVDFALATEISYNSIQAMRFCACHLLADFLPYVRLTRQNLKN